MMNRNRINFSGYLFIFVPIVLVIIIMLYPFFKAIYYSFNIFNGFSEPVFIGLKNYINLFSDGKFLISIRNNFIIAFTAPLFVFIPLILAVILFQNKGYLLKTTRMLIMLPYAISMTISGIFFKAFLQYNGPINDILNSIGLNFLVNDWINNSLTALPIVILTAFWMDFGLFTVIFLAGLSNLDQEILDAAKVDGVNWFQELRYIIIPQLNPIMVFVTALVLIADFRGTFDYIYNLTSGGPGFSTNTLEFLLFQEGFRYFKMGYACAIGVIIFVIIFIFTSLQIRVMSRRD